MKWITHECVAVGLAVALGLPLPALAGVAAGSVLPDVLDMKLAKALSPMSSRQAAFNRIHRGFTHWFGWWAALALPLLLGGLKPGFSREALFLFGLGFGGLAHVGLDMCTISGVPTVPWSKKRRIALKLCHQGRHVRFFTATGLANVLQERQQRGTLKNFLKSLANVELLVLDEIGFITLHREASELLFQIVSDCYEQKSLIITSNLEFSQWNTVFGNDKLTAAMIDRLIHHSHILVFSGPSHRLEDSMARQRRGGEPK